MFITVNDIISMPKDIVGPFLCCLAKQINSTKSSKASAYKPPGQIPNYLVINRNLLINYFFLYCIRMSNESGLQ